MKKKKDYTGYIYSIDVKIHINYCANKLKSEEIKEMQSLLKKQIDKYMSKRSLF